MRDFGRGFLAALAMMLALCAGCPKPSPTPVGPTPDADAARPVRHALCSAAAKHYAEVCASSDESTTEGLCVTIVPNVPGYSDCLAKATGCTACDGAESSGPAPVHGR